MTIVVGKTWEKIVKDPTKDVLLNIYAPWCQYCQALEPFYEQLANEVADIEDLVIAKIDAEANEIADDKVDGYPTIIFYSKTNKKGVEYEEESDEDFDEKKFKTFLSKQSPEYKALIEAKKKAQTGDNAQVEL